MTIKTDIKQQEKLEKFFKEENTWFPDNVGEKFLAIFFFIISGILGCSDWVHVLHSWRDIYGHEIQILSGSIQH